MERLAQHWHHTAGLVIRRTIVCALRAAVSGWSVLPVSHPAVTDTLVVILHLHEDVTNEGDTE